MRKNIGCRTKTKEKVKFDPERREKKTSKMSDIEMDSNDGYDDYYNGESNFGDGRMAKCEVVKKVNLIKSWCVSVFTSG